MACGWAKHTGGLGVCVGTTGPGAIHLMNGLYDAAFDGAPVVALTGLTFHDLRGVRSQQSVDTVKLMEPRADLRGKVSSSFLSPLRATDTGSSPTMCRPWRLRCGG
jgi:thiamine pyrophosphate-dependent acetolactate synthase large subunit-like protein